MSTPRRLSVLLFADDRRDHAGTVLDYIGALRRLSRHDVHVFNPVGLSRARLLSLHAIDVVVIHYSVFIDRPAFLAPWFGEQIRAFRGLKVQFIQDEYRTIDHITAEMNRLGIDVIFSATPAAEARRLYSQRVPGAEIVSTLTGYVPDRLLGRTVPPLEDRPIDVGYRGRVVPFWLGDLAQDKVRICRDFLEHAAGRDLRCDIAWREQDRIYGAAWDRFIASCRCLLGTESGASIADWDGSAEKAVRSYLEDRPDASYEEVHDALLAPYEGNLRIQVISPRAFEAIGHGTALIQFPGHYSGILKPWEHYIPLAKDFSNIDEVTERIHDLPFLRDMTRRAHAEIVASGTYSYRTLIHEFDAIIDAKATHTRRTAVPVPIGLARPAAHAETSVIHAMTRAESHVTHSVATAQAGVTHTIQRARGLRTTARHRMRGSSAWARGEQLVRLALLVRATLPHPSLRRLLWTLLRNRSLRRRTLTSGGRGDLLRVALLAESVRRPHRLGYRATVVEKADGTLYFVSQEPAQPVRPSTLDRATLRARLCERQVPRIVWHHALEDGLISYPLMGSRRVRLPIGMSPGQTHEFTALLALADSSPVAVADALAAVLAASDPR